MIGELGALGDRGFNGSDIVNYKIVKLSLCCQHTPLLEIEFWISPLPFQKHRISQKTELCFL